MGGVEFSLEAENEGGVGCFLFGSRIKGYLVLRW